MKNCLTSEHTDYAMHKTEQKSQKHGQSSARVSVYVCVHEEERRTHVHAYTRARDTTRKRKTGHGRWCVVCWSCHDVKRPSNTNAHRTAHAPTQSPRMENIRVPYTSTLLLSILSRFQRNEMCAYDNANNIHRHRLASPATHSWGMGFIRFPKFGCLLRAHWHSVDIGPYGFEFKTKPRRLTGNQKQSSGIARLGITTVFNSNWNRNRPKFTKNQFFGFVRMNELNENCIERTHWIEKVKLDSVLTFYEKL